MKHKAAGSGSDDAGMSSPSLTGDEAARSRMSPAAAGSGPLVYRRRGPSLQKAVHKRAWRGRKHHPHTFTQLHAHSEAASLATKALLSLAAVHASSAVAQQLQQQLVQKMRKPTAHAAAVAGLDTAGELQQMLPQLQEDVVRACSKAAAGRAAESALRRAGGATAGSETWCEAVAAAATEATAAALRMASLVQPVMKAVSDLYAAAIQAHVSQQQLAAAGAGRQESSSQALKCLQQLVEAIMRS